MIQLSSTLEGVSTRKDGSLSLRFGTQELDSETAVEVMEYRNKHGWLMFAPNRFSSKDIPKEPAPEGGKSQSQRLRSVLFVEWTQKGATEDFEQHYRGRINSFIEKVKQGLD